MHISAVQPPGKLSELSNPNTHWRRPIVVDLLLSFLSGLELGCMGFADIGTHCLFARNPHKTWRLGKTIPASALSSLCLLLNFCCLLPSRRAFFLLNLTPYTLCGRMSSSRSCREAAPPWAFPAALPMTFLGSPSCFPQALSQTQPGMQSSYYYYYYHHHYYFVLRQCFPW